MGLERVRNIALAGVLICTACAPTIWDKPGATQADFNADSYACERDTRQSGYFGGGLVGALEMRQFAERCMVAHGYEKRAQ